ncbi:MAG: DUF1552 domain-containing protein [Planctomycetales bacterium]|nr:DUF1552 domain-containing protein [Planctomycetales bacterium]
MSFVFKLGRRNFLRAAGVSIALPLLDRFSRGDEELEQPPQRMVLICTTLGLYGPNFFPETEGNDYQAPAYLKVLEQHRRDFTVFSGLSHPEQNGSDGHASERTWLTAARHPGLAGFRNSISVDQFAAEQLGFVTRFPSLVLGTTHSSQSYTHSGVMIPAEASPSQIYADLFVAGTPDEIARQRQRLSEGRSVLDAVRREISKLSQTSTPADQARLEEYFESVRQMERRLLAQEEWLERPKPKVELSRPEDVREDNDLIGRMEALFQLIPLILQTDSTRVVTVTVQGRNDVPPVPGVSIDHHNLSHHGQEAEKIRQLELIEQAQMAALDRLLADLKAKTEGPRRLLDLTAVLFGSNLGNANSHDWHNLPIMVAGGGFDHGRHVAFPADNNMPLSNLFVKLLQTRGIEVESFGTSSGSLDW